MADLTSETIVRAAGSFGSFDSGKGSTRAWLFGIAAHVYAQYCSQTASGREAVVRLAGMGDLPVDEIDELTDRSTRKRRLASCSRTAPSYPRLNVPRSSWSTSTV